jgi:hypothetical protein
VESPCGQQDPSGSDTRELWAEARGALGTARTQRHQELNWQGVVGGCGGQRWQRDLCPRPCVPDRELQYASKALLRGWQGGVGAVAPQRLHRADHGGEGLDGEVGGQGKGGGAGGARSAGTTKTLPQGLCNHHLPSPSQQGGGAQRMGTEGGGGKVLAGALPLSCQLHDPSRLTVL